MWTCFRTGNASVASIARIHKKYPNNMNACFRIKTMRSKPVIRQSSTEKWLHTSANAVYVSVPRQGSVTSGASFCGITTLFPANRCFLRGEGGSVSASRNFLNSVYRIHLQISLISQFRQLSVARIILWLAATSIERDKLEYAWKVCFGEMKIGIEHRIWWEMIWQGRVRCDCIRCMLSVNCRISSQHFPTLIVAIEL